MLQLQPVATLLPIGAWQEKGLVANASVSFLRPFQRLSWDISSKTNRVFGHIATHLIRDFVHTELACLDIHPGSLVTEMVHACAVFGSSDMLSVQIHKSPLLLVPSCSIFSFSSSSHLFLICDPITFLSSSIHPLSHPQFAMKTTPVRV